MKKNKLTKLALALGTVATVVAPVATVVSCGSTTTVDPDKNIIVQAEKEWTPIYNQIINDFKADPTNAQMLKDAGLDNIVIQEMETKLVKEQFLNKGIRDSSSPDLFALPTDEFAYFTENNYLKEYSEKTIADFEKAQGITFDESTKPTQIAATRDGKLYGAPENVQAMVKMALKDNDKEGKDQAITRFSDLWMSAGYFNTVDKDGSEIFNLRDIVKTNGEKVEEPFSTKDYDTPTIKNSEVAFNGLVAGFKNVLLASEPIKDIDGFNADSKLAAPYINGLSKQGYSIFAGAWDKDAIRDSAGADIVATAVATKDNWTQWGGGRTYGINQRVNDKKRAVIEKLIGQFYKTKYAEQLFTDAAILSPTTAGKDSLTKVPVGGQSFDQKEDGIPTATYGSKLILRPEDSAFKNVWTIYANEIPKNGKNIISLDRDDPGAVTKLAESLANEFKTDLVAAVKNANDLNGVS